MTRQPMARHAVCSLLVSLACTRANAASLDGYWCSLVSAVTLATADGSPLSGAWS